MDWDYSIEGKITEGKVAIIRAFEVSFDKIKIIFENSCTGRKKMLNFSRVISLSIEADFGVDYDDDMDIMAYRALIGFGFKKTEKAYIYAMKIDDYELVIKSLTPVSIDAAV